MAGRCSWRWSTHTSWRRHIWWRRSHSILLSNWWLHHWLLWWRHCRWWTSHWSWPSHWHSRCTHSNPSTWSSQTCWSLLHHWCDLHRSCHRLCSTHSTHCCSFSYSSASLSRWSLCTHRHNVVSSQKYKTKRSFHLTFLIFRFLRLDLSEFFRISQYTVHVLIKGNESTNQSARILNRYSNPIVNPLQEFTAPRHFFFFND